MKTSPITDNLDPRYQRERTINYSKKVITVRVYQTPEIYQDCHLYLLLNDTDAVVEEAEIKMPIGIQPSDIMTDVCLAIENEYSDYDWPQVKDVKYTIQPFQNI